MFIAIRNTRMAMTYTVKQGDYLVKIARENGFLDDRTIWEHPQNKSLKEKRKNPGVLFPGDVIFIPDCQDKEESGATGQKHRFELSVAKNQLRLILEDLYGNRIGNARCELHVNGTVFNVTSMADGKIEQQIPIDAQEAELIVTDGDTSLKGVKLNVQIGHLDPVEERSGQKARLSNLGYYLGRLEDDDDLQFRCAVEEFQCDNGLQVDGDCGPKTQSNPKRTVNVELHRVGTSDVFRSKYPRLVVDEKDLAAMPGQTLLADWDPTDPSAEILGQIVRVKYTSTAGKIVESDAELGKDRTWIDVALHVLRKTPATTRPPS
jgi:N-acetylmuramoyl-L-alanine amidase